MIGMNDRQTITYTFQKHEKMLIETPDSDWKVCHGTYFQNLKYILSEGLSCMHREFIHLSPTDSITGAQNGLRNDYDCLIYINIEAAMQDGIVFSLTTDNVILTTGFEGFLTKEYFHKILVFQIVEFLFIKASSGWIRTLRFSRFMKRKFVLMI